ncbi:hypothetical protein YC2023_016948 [Brassica napus]
MATEEEADEYNISEVDWGEEPGYSWEDQNYGDGSEENDQYRESWTEDGHEEEPCRRELEFKPPDHYTSHTINKSYSKPWIKFTDKFYDNIPRVLTKTLVSFSGKENYSRWEEGMENYFWEYRVPEHKKLSIALDALVGEAYQWWLQEEKCRIHFKEPTLDWEYVKGLMYEHFEMRRLPPRAYPKPLVKLKPKKLHEHEEEVKTLETIFSGKRTRKSTSSATPFQRGNTCPMVSEKAQRYWNREEKYREKFQEPPIRTWEQFKGVMRDRFSPHSPTQHAQKVSTKRVVQPQFLQPTNQRQSSKPVHTPQVKRTQGEYSSQGHLAKDCPKKWAVKLVLPEPKETNFEVSQPFTRMDDFFTRIDKKFDDLINLIKAGSYSVSTNSMTVLTHLSSVQKVENISGTNMEIKEQEPDLSVQASPRLENFQVPTNDKVISELNVNNPTYQNTGMMHLHSVQNVDEGLGKEKPRPEAHQPEVYEQYTIETFSPADHALKMTKTKAESMQDAMSDNRVSKPLNITQHSVLESSTSSMKHLLLPISVDSGIGTMEKNPAPNSKSYTQRVVNGETKSETGYFPKETTLLLRKNIDRPCRGDIASLLIKQKQPDGHCITKPSIYHGKTLASQNRMKPNLLYLGADKLVLRTKNFEEGGNDEDLNYIGDSSDIGASKEGYLCDHEDFCRETTSYRFSTQPEHAANWFYTKRSSGLGDTTFTSQATYTASELVLYKESNSLLKECATQTHVWMPGDHSLHLRPVGELIPCTKPHWMSQILHHLNLPFLEQIYNKSEQLFLSMIASTLAICSINHKIPKAPRIFPKLYLDHQALCGFTCLSDWRLRLLVESGCCSSWFIVEPVNTMFCLRSSSSLPSSRVYSRLDRLEEPPLLLDQSSL